MRARLRSYGETSTRTRSPGRIRMRKRRIFPATWPSTSWPLSSCTRNIAFGSASTTSPSNSTFSSLAKLDDPHVGGLGARRGLAQLVLDLRAVGEREQAVARDSRIAALTGWWGGVAGVRPRRRGRAARLGVGWGSRLALRPTIPA